MKGSNKYNGNKFLWQDMKMIKRVVSIIVPVFNEETTIDQVIQTLTEQKIPGWFKQIIVVDDGSTAKTAKKLKKFLKKVTFLSHKNNIGKGGAIKTALKLAKGEIVIIQDADSEYSPKDILSLIKQYHPDNSAAVYGSRRLKTKRGGYPLYITGDWLANFFFRFFFREKLTDIFTGYKLVKTFLLKKMKLKSRGFEIEMEITNWLVRNKWKITEVPISYNPRTFAKGKKLGIIKGSMLFLSVFKYKFF